MTFKQNVTELRSYIKQAPPENRAKIQDVIKLYEEKKIPNIRTAFNAVVLLSSKNKNTIKSGRVEKEYEKLMVKYTDAEPMTGRLTRPPDYTISSGDHSKVKSHIDININTKKLDKDGHETRSLKQLLNQYKDKLINLVGQVLETKRSMKIMLKVDLKVDKPLAGFDGEVDYIEKNVWLANERAVTVTRANVKNVINSLKDQLDAKMDYSNEMEGSGWGVTEYSKVSVAIYETKPLRASSYIPTPEKYTNPKCGLINIKNEDQRCLPIV